MTDKNKVVRERYRRFLDNWPKKAGRKPSLDILRTVQENLDVRPGSKSAVAQAMYLRDEGASSKQIESVLGKPHHNKRRELLAKKVVIGGPIGKDEEGRTIYRIELPPHPKSKSKTKNVDNTLPNKH